MALRLRLLRLILLVCCLVTATGSAEATIVRMQIGEGNDFITNLYVRLYDTATPASVQNFLYYVNNGFYDHSFIHRSPPGFVVQGGSYLRRLDEFQQEQVYNVPTQAAVQNEFGILNTQGTLAYAKLGGQPNSATSGWFFNVFDNPNLDVQNGGFTVFGRVLFNGINVVQYLNSRPTDAMNTFSIFSEAPVLGLDTTTTDGDGLSVYSYSEYYYTQSVRVLNVLEGDYNFDGEVDALDYAVWRESLGSTTQAEADGNGDGVVNQLDLAIWQDNYGASFTTSVPAAPVPEPASWALAAMLLWGAARRPTRHV